MPAPDAGSIIAVSFLGDCNGQRIMNTIHYRLTVAWDSATLELFYDAFHDLIKVTGTYDITTPYLDVHATNYTLDLTRLQVVYPLRYRAKDYLSGGSGTRTGSCTAQNVAAVLTKRVELSGRSKVGSIHIGGISASDYIGGELSGALTAAFGALKTALLSLVFQEAGPGLAAPVLYHPKAPAPVYDFLTQLVLQPQVRTQRSRTVGKGE